MVTRHNEHEREAFGRLARELGAEATFSTPSLNLRFVGKDQSLVELGLAPDLKKIKQRDHTAHWLPRDLDFVIEPYRQVLEGRYDPDQWNGKKLYDCEWPWRSAVVNWDGNVATCCGSFDPKNDMGNVFDQRFGKIWNGPKYRLARRSYKTRLHPEQARDNPCASCPVFLI